LLDVSLSATLRDSLPSRGFEGEDGVLYNIVRWVWVGFASEAGKGLVLDKLLFFWAGVCVWGEEGIGWVCAAYGEI